MIELRSISELTERLRIPMVEMRVGNEERHMVRGFLDRDRYCFGSAAIGDTSSICCDEDRSSGIIFGFDDHGRITRDDYRSESPGSIRIYMGDDEVVAAVRQDRTACIARVSGRSSRCRNDDAVPHDALGSTATFWQFDMKIVLANSERISWLEIDITESEMLGNLSVSIDSSSQERIFFSAKTFGLF